MQYSETDSKFFFFEGPTLTEVIEHLFQDVVAVWVKAIRPACRW